MPRLAANLSMLFREVTFLDRFGAAARAGFRAVECQFPYEHDAAAIREQLVMHGLTLVLHNLPAGDWAAGERGIACHPDRIREFEAGVERGIEYAIALGCGRLNCLAGIRPPSVTPDTALKTLIRNLRHAAAVLKSAGVTLLLEPLNTQDVPGFFLSHTRDALDVIGEVAADNLALQFDIYHMQIMDGDVASLIEHHAASIGHIQIAAVPGRHEPGTGEIDFQDLLSRIDACGYAGWVGCEYNPAGATADGLGWAAAYLAGKS